MLDLFFISLHSLKLYASHYTQCTETTYFKCRHYTQYYLAGILFFRFITSLTIYVHLITISHLRQFPSVVYISLYLFISVFFFHLITPKHYSENSLQVCLSHIHLLFCEFWDGCFLHSIAKFLLYQTHLKPTLSTSEPPILLCRERKNTGFPWIWLITSPYTQGPSKLPSCLAH